MQVDLIDDYTDVSVKFRDKLYDLKFHMLGNPLAPAYLNRETLKNIPYLNVSEKTDLHSEFVIYSNLGYQPDLGQHIPFMAQEGKLPKITFEKIMLNLWKILTPKHTNLIGEKNLMVFRCNILIPKIM